MLISKTFDFDAAHFLPMVPDGHKCRRLHGHTYRVEVRVSGAMRADGMVCDYAEIAEAWQPLHGALDHRLLNEIPGLENPTTEVLAAYILAALVSPGRAWSVSSVRVYESSSTWCEAAKGDGEG